MSHGSTHGTILWMNLREVSESIFCCLSAPGKRFVPCCHTSHTCTLNGCSYSRNSWYRRNTYMRLPRKIHQHFSKVILVQLNSIELKKKWEANWWRRYWKCACEYVVGIKSFKKIKTWEDTFSCLGMG
jgi:hypothetical protein